MTTPGPAATSSPTRRGRPNVIIVYLDDLGWGELGCYGGDHPTPHLDALAARGVRATDWYANAPVCSPSRASLLTGQHPQRTGVTAILGGRRGTPGLDPERSTTLAGLLQANGYATGIFGKWHLGTTPAHRPTRHGFDEFFGFLAGCVDYYSHIFYWGQGRGVDPVHDLWQEETEVWENGRYLTESITERALDFVDRNADRPFFCYLPYNAAPHYPMHAPQRYLDRFPDLPLERRVTAAMVAAVDDGVGALVERLERYGLLDDTMIVFSSDNGPSVETRNWLDGTGTPWPGGRAGGVDGHGFSGHKGSLLEGGIREPFLISYPGGLPSGGVHEAPAQMCDVVPTVLGLAGLPIPTGLDGRDRTAELCGAPSDPEEPLFWPFEQQLAVRTGRWKLSLRPWLDFDRRHELELILADLSADPGETEDRSAEQPELTERLRRSVETWAAALAHADRPASDHD